MGTLLRLQLQGDLQAALPTNLTSGSTAKSATTATDTALPRLVGVLVEVGLAELAERACAWCLEMGAAFLGEVLEEHASFCSALGLDIAKQEQFRMALLAEINGGGIEYSSP